MRSIKSRANSEDVVTPLAAPQLLDSDTFFTFNSEQPLSCIIFLLLIPPKRKISKKKQEEKMKQTERDRVNEEMVRRYGEINAQYGLSEVTTLEDALNLDIETGEHMRLNLSALDRIIWEEAQTISDGKALFEHTPSSLTPHHRYGMRLNKKYRAGKRAFLAAYMLSYGKRHWAGVQGVV